MIALILQLWRVMKVGEQGRTPAPQLQDRRDLPAARHPNR
jgi:hypothetical protein